MSRAARRSSSKMGQRGDSSSLLPPSSRFIWSRFRSMNLGYKDYRIHSYDSFRSRTAETLLNRQFDSVISSFHQMPVELGATTATAQKSSQFTSTFHLLLLSTFLKHHNTSSMPSKDPTATLQSLELQSLDTDSLFSALTAVEQVSSPLPCVWSGLMTRQFRYCCHVLNLYFLICLRLIL